MGLNSPIPSQPSRWTYHRLAAMSSQADWLTQRQRCGRDVVYWMCLECGLRVSWRGDDGGMNFITHHWMIVVIDTSKQSLVRCG